MVEVIWGILNIGILIYFILICCKATKIIRGNIGGIAALVFVLGLLSFMGKPHEENGSSQIFDLEKENKGNEPKGLNRFVNSKEILIEENLTTKIAVTVLYTENKSEKELVKAMVNRDGFIFGTYWKANHIDISKANHNPNYEYRLLGTIDWKILGIKLYTQMKEFNGIIKLNK